MELYQLAKTAAKISVLGLIFTFLAACGQLQPGPGNVEISVSADGVTESLEVPAGTTAREALHLADVEIDSLDKSDPPLYAVLQIGDTVTLTRVSEGYEIEDAIIPYDTQLLQNESLAEGDSRLIQPGANGLQENTYRILYENGIEVSRTLSSTRIVNAAVPEIVMVGSQVPFSVIPLPGILAYISAGNAWVMRENTGIRQPVVTTGDLDGRVLEISPDGRWLLFTRAGESEEEINSLWVAEIGGSEPKQFDLGVENLIHFAEWVPGSKTGIVYSTSEMIPGPPGWQANNDLVFINFSEDSGWTSSARESLKQNLGGLYGWWGTDFHYSQDGERLAFSRPDGIGLVDLESERLTQLYEALPVQTRSDWAWIPPMGWSPDGSFIYFVDHVPQENLSIEEESQMFDLAVYPFVGGGPVSVVKDVGMFAYPQASPLVAGVGGVSRFSVAFLRAVEPRQSRTSDYELMVMDQDGSNLRMVFPTEGGQGLAPHKFEWLPWYAVGEFPMYIAVIYQGDLWLVDTASGEAQQMTGDKLVTAIDWK